MADLKTPKGREMAPLKGDPDTLAGEVTRMKNVAATIEKLTGMLSDIHEKRNSQSQKIDTIRDTAGEAGDALKKAKSLYNDTGWALADYNTQLRTSIADAKSAYDDAVALLPSLNTAETNADAATTAQKNLANDPAPTTPEETAAAKTKSDNAGTAVTQANQTLGHKQELMRGYGVKWDKAYDDLNSAADTARGRIKNAIEHSPAKDSWWDNFAGFLSALSSILGWVALALVIVAIFLTGPLALAFLAIATALTVVKLLADSALAATGKGSWRDVAFDAVALIPFGKLLGKGLSMSSRFTGTMSELGRSAKFWKPFTTMAKGGFNGLRNGGLKAGAKGLLDGYRGGPKALQEAVDLAGKTAKGTPYVRGNWAQDGAKAVDNATSRWNIVQSMKAGGSAEYSHTASVLDALPGRNQAARDAIETARDYVAPHGTAVGFSYAGQQATGGGYTGFVAGSGGDWTTNAVTGLFDSGPSDADLKARILAPAMAVPAAQLPEPVWSR